jgi:putative spermidine/putrescine transport system permease protein
VKEAQNIETGSANNRAGSRYWRSKSAYLGVLPFFLFTGVFLFYPTINVALGAFQDQKNRFSTKILFGLLQSSTSRHAFSNSLQISFKTAIAGSILGGLFAWALTTGKPGGIFYRVSVALSSVLAQFGGVMLTFAFLATFGFNGVVSSLAIKFAPNTFLASSSWLY